MNDDERAILGYTRRLESLAKRATIRRWFSSDGFEHYLDLQKQIFRLQMEIQRAIGEVKSTRKKSAKTRSHLESLRNRRWLARRLGDAIAWQALLHNRQLIHALNKNAPIPVPSAWSDGHRGAFEFAKATTSREWGIPIIHDITSVLRIGDVTFMSPSESGSPQDAVFRTVELKTTRVGESVNEHVETSTNVHVTVIGNEPHPIGASPPTGEGEIPSPIRQRRPDRRIERQLARMDLATAAKNAPINQVTKIGEDYSFGLQLPKEEQPHWKELRRAIRAARRDGFAYFELGGFVGYSLIYNESGVTVDDIKASPLPDNVMGLMHEEISDRNSITVSSLPDEENDSFSSRTMPFFL